MISNVTATSGSANSIWLLGQSGNVYVDNVNSQMSNASVIAHIYISPTGASDGFGESIFSNMELDGGGGNASIFLNPTGGAQCFGFQFDSIMMTGGANPGHAAISCANTENVAFSNMQIRGVGTSGAVIALATDSSVSFDNVTIGDLTGGGVAGISVVAAITGLEIRNCRIGYGSTGAVEANMNNAINFGSANSTNVSLLNNDLYGVSGAITLTPASVTTWNSANNRGIKDTTAAASSASTLAFPYMDDGQIIAISGTTTVTAVSQLRTGQFGYIQTPGAVPFSAGATIGNTITTTAGGLATFTFDGTKIWVK